VAGGRTTALHCAERAYRYRRYLVRTETNRVLVAKFLGFGVWAEVEATDLHTAPLNAPCLGVADGFLWHEWVTGIPLWSGTAITNRELDQLGVQVGWTAERGCAALRNGNEYVQALSEWVNELGLTYIVANLADIDTPIPVISAPTNGGGWHLLRGSQLFRVHQDSGHWVRFIDPVEDIAAIGLEAAMSKASVERLLRSYSDRSGDSVTLARWRAACVAHVCRVIDERLALEDEVDARSPNRPRPGWVRLRERRLAEGLAFFSTNAIRI